MKGADTMKKIISLILIITLFAILPGCGKKEPQEVSTTGLTGEIKYLTQRTDIVNTTLNDFVKKFEAKYPGTKVTLEAVKDYKKIVSTRLAAGEIADVFHNTGQIKAEDFPKFYEPLDDLGFNGKIRFQEDYSEGGKLYALPASANVTGLVYNKATWKKAGIEKTPQTLDELFEVCEKLKAAGVVPTSPLAKEQWPADMWSYKSAPLFSGDGDYYSDMVSKKRPFVSEAPIVGGVNILKALQDKGYFEKDLMSTTWDDFKKGLATGRFGFILMENWLIPQIIENGANPEDVGFCALPINNSGNVTTLSRPDIQVVINKDSKNMALAKEFVKFMMTDGYEDWLKMGGTFPTVDGVDMNFNPQLDEFLKSGIEIVWGKNESDDFKTMINKAQIKWPEFTLNCIAGDINTALEKYNDAWEKAKAELGL